MIAAFDTETSGIDVETARIVTAAFVLLDDSGAVVESKQWVIDPGVDIPTEASDVHGYTNERIAEMTARGETTTPEVSIPEIAWTLENCVYPVVIYNAAYDTTVLDREVQRVDGHDDRLRIERMTVVDPLVIDKAVDRYRKGSRKLVDTAKHYGVPLEEAHDALGDCIMAAKVALALRPHFKGWSREELLQFQVTNRQEQADSLRAYFDRVGTEHDGIPGDWPMHPRKG